MGTVIAITSGKGGTGKTSITGGVASCLAQMGYCVLCIDMDIGLRNLDITLGLNDRALMDFADVALGRCPLARAAVGHPELKSLYLLTSPMSLSPASPQTGSGPCWPPPGPCMTISSSTLPPAWARDSVWRYAGVTGYWW